MRLRFLSFRSDGKKFSGERPLVGFVQPETGYNIVEDNIFDCFDTEKPTYYFDADGKQVDYITHAQFIADNSFRSFDGGVYWLVYPMLTFEDRTIYNAVILKITHYERKIETIEAHEQRLVEQIKQETEGSK